MHVNYPPIEDVEFEIACEPEEISIRGNAMASGDDEADEAYENEIIRQLENGNEWAWCCVIVKATWGPFSGTDILGGCSYASEADFRQPGGYFDDMRRQAYEELCSRIWHAANSIEPLLA